MDQLILTSDGSHSLLSGRYGVSYHSRYGAVQETEHVFLQAALRYYLKQYTPATLSVLEMGFGTGLNAFMTLLEAEARQLPVHFTTIEAYPIQEALADQLNFPEVLQAPAADPWFRRLHRCSWETAEPISPFFTLEKSERRYRTCSWKGDISWSTSMLSLRMHSPNYGKPASCKRCSTHCSRAAY